jgi:hypothetical protein
MTRRPPTAEAEGGAWPGWGLTRSPTLDQIRLLRELVTSRSVLGYLRRRPPQARVALKDGWLPLDAAGTDWQVNSIGWVSGLGRDYLIAVLSTGNPSEDYGIAAIGGPVAGRVALRRVVPGGVLATAAFHVSPGHLEPVAVLLVLQPPTTRHIHTPR